MKYAKWWLPILLMALLTPFTPFLDLEIERYFYRLGNGQFVSNSFTDFFYNYGVIPAEITVIFAVVALLLSYPLSSWKKWRQPSLILILTLALGAGVIVHMMLKDQWGRPRPKQVIEFGGTQQFRPYYIPNFSNQPEPSKSFTCGHCSMGFFFLRWR